MAWKYLSLASLAVIAACSSSSSNQGASTTPPAAVTQAAGDANATASAASGAAAWGSMSHEQKMDYMQNTVMPEMRRMFQEFDGQRFANFSCRTCHGENPQAVNWHMPNGIAPLDPSTIPAMFASQDRMHVFMTQRLWPRMTALLGKQPYNPETHQGFGCMGCHGMRMPAGAPAAH